MSPKKASSSLYGCWCVPFAPSPHWSCYSRLPAPNKSWHSETNNIHCCESQRRFLLQNWQVWSANIQCEASAFAWPFLASNQHLTRFHGVMSYSESTKSQPFDIMSSSTIQLGPLQPCSEPGKVTHVLMVVTDQLQLLFCCSEPLEQGHPNLSTGLSKRPATCSVLKLHLRKRWSIAGITSPNLLESNGQLFFFPSVVSPCRSLSSCALVRHLPGPGGLAPP